MQRHHLLLNPPDGNRNRNVPFDIMLELIKQLRAANPYGFTVTLPDLQPVTEGISVAYEETQDSHSDEEIQRCIDHALTHGHIVGGWLDTDGKFYYDSCRIFTDLDKAKAWGRQQGQIAIYDIGKGEPHYL